MTGKIFFVGSGVFNISYLTLRGYYLLSNAEVVIYDTLIDSSLLELVPVNCLKIYVGKRRCKLSTHQKYINNLLVNHCLLGKKIVRLKGGDPSLFGRLTEEVYALKQANCKYEIIPGISSALAAPVLAGIPITDKKTSQCFTILTGHDLTILDWETLARSNTLIILMGIKNLSKIIDKLIINGKSPNESVAIVHNCGSSNQITITGTLKTIVDKIVANYLSPAIIIIGEVVKLRNMPSSSNLPLAGKKVIITRSHESSSQFKFQLQEAGADVITLPLLEILPPSSWERLDGAIQEISSFDWLVLTSANGVKFFMERLHDLGKDIRILNNIKIAVVGKKTADYLKKFYLKPNFIPSDFIADSLVENFPEDINGKKILFPRVETGGRDILLKEFIKKGASITEVPAYQSICPKNIDNEIWKILKNEQVDIITFTSSKIVKHFYHLFKNIFPDSVEEKKILSKLDNVYLACIGPQTSKTCNDLFGRVDVEAKEYTLEGLTNQLIDYFS